MCYPAKVVSSSVKSNSTIVSSVVRLQRIAFAQSMLDFEVIGGFPEFHGTMQKWKAIRISQKNLEGCWGEGGW